MRVFICQLKRIFRAPFFLGLLAVFLAFDLYLVFSEASGHKNDWENCRRSVNMVNSVAEETGTKINSTDFKKKFAVVLDSHKRDLKSFYHQKTGKESDDLSVMLDSLEGNIYQMTRGEKNRLYDDTTVLNMENILQNRFGVYRNTDFKKDGETYIHEEKLEGFQAEFIRKNSAALQSRVKEIETDGEEDELYFPGNMCRTHGFLYGILFRALVFESALLGVLIMMYIVNFEFMHGTQALAYSSRRGRKLATNQFGAAFISGLLVPALLMAVVLPAYFALFNFSNLWNVSVSSPLNVEMSGIGFFPVITWTRMTVLQYLWATIGIAFALQAVFCLLAFAVAVFFRNNYAGFIIYAILSMGIIMVPERLPWSTPLPVITAANPFTAWKNCGSWLALSEPTLTYPTYFPVLFLLWGAIAAVVIFFGIRRFRRADL